jgi:cysteine-rich repeat protein
LVRSGFQVLDDCSARRSGATSCAHLDGRDRFARAIGRAEGIVKYWCSKEFTILQNYPSSDPTAADVIFIVAPVVQTILEDSTKSVFTGAARGANPRARKRCVRAIAGGRSLLASSVLAEAVGCQQTIDRQASGFGELAASCLGDASRQAARVAKKIARACGGLTGADVGSCDPLPDCVIASARATGHELARVTYGVKAVCSNAKVEPGETCDDGAANSASGACTDACQKATCGDGKVQAGVEDCDNGKNQFGQNFDSETCTATCEAVVCGNGILQPGEQCDDGNTDPGDGCSPTCRYEPFPCGAGGTLDVTVTLVPDQNTFSATFIEGIKLGIGYPTTFSVPGTGVLDDPATAITLLSTDPNGINLSDGSTTVFDNDTAPPLRIVTFVTLNPTANLLLSQTVPFQSIHFGCPAGTPVTEADFPCAIDSMVDAIARALQPDQFPDCVVTLPRGGPH